MTKEEKVKFEQIKDLASSADPYIAAWAADRLSDYFKESLKKTATPKTSKRG